MESPPPPIKRRPVLSIQITLRNGKFVGNLNGLSQVFQATSSRGRVTPLSSDPCHRTGRCQGCHEGGGWSCESDLLLSSFFILCKPQFLSAPPYLGEKECRSS